MRGQQNLAAAIAYRQHLQQLRKQRQGTDAQMEATGTQARQSGEQIAAQGRAALEKLSLLDQPPTQQMNYGGNRYNSTLAERTPVNVTLPEFPNYPSAYPDAPKIPKEPVGELERTAKKYFYSMSENSRHSTDKTYYNMWKSEMKAKEKWRKQVEKIEENYNTQVEGYNRGLESYNTGVQSYQQGLVALQSEMQAREEAASRPPIALIESGEANRPRTGQRRSTGRGTLLAGNTGGFNPATGGGRLGGRSLLG
jgi:hypothetical protein